MAPKTNSSCFPPPPDGPWPTKVQRGHRDHVHPAFLLCLLSPFLPRVRTPPFEKIIYEAPKRVRLSFIVLFYLYLLMGSEN